MKDLTINKSIVIDLLKGKPLPVGTVKNWNGIDYKKIAEGQWLPVKKMNKPVNYEQPTVSRNAKNPNQKLNVKVNPNTQWNQYKQPNMENPTVLRGKQDIDTTNYEIPTKMRELAKKHNISNKELEESYFNRQKEVS